ncbi:hypothetical protein APS56_02485 [Pseudalgibacter alginicilyticus]|uniref:Polyketide cyclase n=2 Tax=Pseudalgibacter alginicilyticus TaxID=1736674 RepID=A0A0P0D0A3_9FLAO|nr:hypothetical protein APS56_02485 [Pseudalgibacter alginicilyticus]
MKMLVLKIAVVVIAIISVLCVIAIFTAKKYTIKREITLNNSNSEIYEFLRFHKNQKLFNQWLSYDPNTKIEIKGSEDGKKGATLHFSSKSKKTGKGEWETTNLVENKRIDFELRFLEPYTFTANGSLYLKEIGANKTNLLWEYHSGMDWPMNITLLFMDMDKIIGKDIEASLAKIKSNTEKL